VIRVCVAGITGWTGGPVADAVRSADDLELVAGVSRAHPGHYSSVADALDAVAPDVLVDYTHASTVDANVRRRSSAASASSSARAGSAPRSTTRSTPWPASTASG